MPEKSRAAVAKTARETSLAKLEEAKQDVEAAEGELETVLSEIRVAPRAEKTAVSRAIESALNRLKAARKALVEAEAILAKDTSNK